MKQLSLAVANYHQTHGSFPPAVTCDAQGRPAHSWRILLLPYLDASPLYKRYSFDEPWDGPNNSKLALEMPKLFAFHGTYKAGQTTETNFVAVTGAQTAWPLDGVSTYEGINDGTGNTIHFAEYNGKPIHWMSPRDLSFDRMSFISGNANGISSQYLEPAVAMVDGAVRRLSPEITPDELRALLTADGNDAGPRKHSILEMEDARLRKLK